MSERHSAPSEAEQQLVFDLVQERLLELFGPNGSFRISVGRSSADEGIFVSTVAETVAHDIAVAFAPARGSEGRRSAARSPQDEHDLVWSQVDAELGIRSTGPDGFLDDLESGELDILVTAEMDLGHETANAA